MRELQRAARRLQQEDTFAAIELTDGLITTTTALASSTKSRGMMTAVSRQAAPTTSGISRGKCQESNEVVVSARLVDIQFGFDVVSELLLCRSQLVFYLFF
jgi:hypothetical protein